MKRYSLLSLCIATALASIAETFESLPYGNMDQWVTRNIKESGVIGGDIKKVYAVGPTTVINGNKAYTNMGGSPWATSNVMAKMAGVTKASNVVYPENRGNGKCAKLCTQMESCKALGLVNINVMVAGTMFLGKMLEPVKSTSDPYSKMEVGMPFTKHPDALVYDYCLTMPASNQRIYSSGFSKKRVLKGHDNAEVLVMLQRRWEDADGNIYAKRVGTARELLGKDSNGWQNKHHLKIAYGDISHSQGYSSRLALMKDKEHTYYARNSKGKMVPVTEVGWDSPDATPTHLIVMFSAGSGEPYVGTPGLTLRVDNVGLAYK